MNRKRSLNRILVIDDDIDFVYIVKMALERAGYKVNGVSDALVALSLAARVSFSLALVDLRLGVEDGSQVALILQRRGVPVIRMSGWPVDHDAAGWKPSEIFLAKPFHMDILIATCDSILGIGGNGQP